MPLARCAALLLLALAALSGCDNKPAAPPPDRDQLYRLFERAAEFSVALDRLDIVCGAPAPGGRVDWLRKQSGMLDSGQQAMLAAFIRDREEAVFETYRKDYCGMTVRTERDNYLEAYQVHRGRLESALAKLKAADGRP
jgi:hypothetical protein